MARKTKYTPETVEKVAQAIRLGSTYILACHYAGISFETFNEWRKAKPEFSDTINAAEGKAAVAWLARIEDASKSQWQAAAWKLERRYPQEYGKTIQEHQGKDGADIHIKVVYDGDNATDKHTGNENP